MDDDTSGELLVRIFRFWKYPNILRQTPDGKGVWRTVRYVLDEPGEADYAIVHGHVNDPVSVRCPPGNVWLVLGEPPNEMFGHWNALPGWISRGYTTDERSVSHRHMLSYPALPWQIDRDYDFLRTCPPMNKTRPLSWVTSNRGETRGHLRRLKYLEQIRAMPELTLLGRGFNPIGDKWEGIAPYRYSIGFENFSNRHYWTEKVADCFLAWTMPIYYGCTELEKYFPPESFARIDPDSADPVADIRRIVSSDLRERNLDAIAEARRLVLEKYNFFEFMTAEIEKSQALRRGTPQARETITISDHTLSGWGRVKGHIRRRLPRPLQRAYCGLARILKGERLASMPAKAVANRPAAPDYFVGDELSADETSA